MNHCHLQVKLLLTLLFIPSVLSAQNEYWVFFKNKSCQEYDFREHLSASSIERRVLSGFSLNDSADMPVNADFITEVSKLVVSIGDSSRWLNAITVWADAMAINAVAQLSFVAGVQLIKALPAELMADKNATKDQDPSLRQLAHVQLSIFIPEEIGKRGLNGAGVSIAVVDAGFPQVGSHPAFKAVNGRKGIKKQYDFIRKEEGPMGGNRHGTQVLSNICGMMDDYPLGFGTGADFLLARTEKAVGPFTKGEKYWWLAAEWADKNGAKIITTSLGYGRERYFEEEMNGKFTSVSRAAAMAAARGILVIAAAGNEGENKNWVTLVSPADADSVLAVGGIDPASGLAAEFGSRGLQLGTKVKPNISAPSTTVTVSRGADFTENYGTSFATPLVAGLAACYWQQFPALTNMQVFQAFEKAGHLYPYFDMAHGYGVPLVNKLFENSPEPKPTFTFENNGDFLAVTINDETNAAINPFLGIDFLYYHLEDNEGKMIGYRVIKVMSMRPLRLNLKSEVFENTHKLRIHFRGYMEEFEINPINKGDE